jgi:hypothetical protein
MKELILFYIDQGFLAKLFVATSPACLGFEDLAQCYKNITYVIHLIFVIS